MAASWKWLFRFDFSLTCSQCGHSLKSSFIMPQMSWYPSHITHKHYVSPSPRQRMKWKSFSTSEAFLQYACTYTTEMHTCDFKPHGNIRWFGGHDAHHVRHRVAFHDRESEGGLLEKQRSRIGRQLWFGNPLDMQTTRRGFLRTSIVDGFNLRERQRMKDCVIQRYAFCCKWVSAQLSDGSQNSLEINTQQSLLI